MNKRMSSAVLPDFQRGIIVQKGQNYRFWTEIDFCVLFFHKCKKISMAKKIVVPL